MDEHATTAPATEQHCVPGAKPERTDERNYLWQLVMLLLSIWILAAMVLELTVPLTKDTAIILETADTFICYVFIGDFVVRFIRSRNRVRFFTRNWINLLASIPQVDALRWGRVLRVVRILRLLRAVRSIKLIFEHISRSRAEHTFATVLLMAAMIWIFSSITILHLETGAGTNIANAQDALWWAFTTITTVGYGDRYPVTLEGRILAGMLMTVGVGLFGTVTAYIANLFLRPSPAAEATSTANAAEIVAIEREVQALRLEVQLLHEKLDVMTGMLQGSGGRVDQVAPENREV